MKNLVKSTILMTATLVSFSAFAGAPKGGSRVSTGSGTAKGSAAPKVAPKAAPIINTAPNARRNATPASSESLDLGDSEQVAAVDFSRENDATEVENFENIAEELKLSDSPILQDMGKSIEILERETEGDIPTVKRIAGEARSWRAVTSTKRFGGVLRGGRNHALRTPGIQRLSTSLRFGATEEGFTSEEQQNIQEACGLDLAG